MRWCRGLGHARGYGIQSPFAYGFVRHVVMAKGIDVADKRTATRTAPCKRHERRVMALNSRIVAWWKPSLIVRDDPVLDEAVAGRRVMVIVTDPCRAADTLRQIPTWATEDTLAFVTDIWRDAAMHDAWQRLVADRRTGVTFDLGVAGVAFFDHRLYRRQYYVNL